MISLSIVVPVYNVEKYIAKCLDSMLSYTGQDIEIIAVVDGSRDNSEEILREYGKKDNRLQVLLQENQGVSTARNTGIKAARGKYVMFVDADDWISSEVLGGMLDMVKKSGFAIQFMISDYIEATDNCEKQIAFGYEKNPSIDEICELAVTSSKMNYCWGKFFDLSIIRENHIEFNRNIKIGEDAIFVMDYLECINEIEYCPQYLYYYRQNPTSAMSRVNVSRFEDMQATYNKRERLSKKLDNTEMIARRIDAYYKDAIDGALRQASKMQISFKEKYKLISKVLSMPFISGILLSSCNSTVKRTVKKAMIKTNIMTIKVILKG